MLHYFDSHSILNLTTHEYILIHLVMSISCIAHDVRYGPTYRIKESLSLASLQESPAENIINMDMQRTYLGHDYFHEPVARDVLYKISKAYSIYDEEVGYCQGLSFIVAVLLLQVGGATGKREV